jgi:putative alpha-1,2-mannosidase
VTHAILHFADGKQLEIKTKKQSAQNVYIQSVTLNGVPLELPQITHSQITGGGILEITLGPKPNKTLFRP